MEELQSEKAPSPQGDLKEAEDLSAAEVTLRNWVVGKPVGQVSFSFSFS